jgi:Glycosyltransferase family 87/WD40-like Beta Propeller Repeat
MPTAQNLQGRVAETPASDLGFTNRPVWQLRLLALLTFLFLLGTSFRTGWSHTETDFPNYYTAAVLIGQHQPLRKFYDWSWFVRQMNYTGNGVALGCYIPQTPLTMLPMVLLSGFSAQRAKQIWLIFNLIFLASTVWMLSRVTRLRFEVIWLMAFCGYFSMRTNFLYGQYYLFLLFVITYAFYFLDRNKPFLGGALMGMAFGLKLYGGPFLLYFLAKRQWKPLVGLILTMLILVGLAIALFGLGDVHYFATQILPRALEGGPIDPYASGTPTISNLLRRTFVGESELNPHPLWQAPWLFFFLRSFTSLVIVIFVFLGTFRSHASDRHDFAWFIIAIVLLSTSASSYTFIILLLPVVLLLEEATPRQSVFLFICYVLLTLPLRPTRIFPEVWLLLALFVVVGLPNWRGMPHRFVLAATAVAALMAFVDAHYRMTSYAKEPAQRFEHAIVQPDAIFSSHPVMAAAGLFYQSIDRNRFVLRWMHDHRNEALTFDGNVLYPRLSSDGQFVEFELVANRTSTMMRFDPSSRQTVQTAMAVTDDPSTSAISPNGKWLAFEDSRNGPSQIWLRDLATGDQSQLTGGHCNSMSPAWELDSEGIIFASDCGRGWGLPSLYRARLTIKKD